MKHIVFLITIASYFTLYAQSDRPRILIDFDPETPAIDSTAMAATGQLIVGIVCQKVVNLDTYTFDVSFNPAVLSFQSAVEDNPLGGLTNILKKNGGQTLNVGLGLKSGCTDTVEINIAIAGLADSAVTPEGDGLLGIILFNVLQAAPCTLAVRNAMLVDYEGGIDTLPVLSNGRLIPPVSVQRATVRTSEERAHFIMVGSAVAGSIPFAAHLSAMVDIRGRAVSRFKNQGARPFGVYIGKRRN
jgi:hypothetical protein